MERIITPAAQLSPARDQQRTPDQVYRAQVAAAAEEIGRTSIRLSDRARERILARRAARRTSA